MYQFAEPEITAKAVQLGLIADGEALPANLRSKAVKALAAALQQQQPAEPALEVGHLVLTPDRRVLLDGHALPLQVLDADPIHVVLHGEVATIRLTVAARTITVHQKENQTSGQA
ncbi:hypothetical protein [Microtetraspora niveoalba]|uniref:hypothetical protein n=1 Tax=Microtetraspora niveoalba TaxID=46175 RepID=UPI00082E7FC7|nr:hypothetical protein [Microtetraspora niveoalba]